MKKLGLLAISVLLLNSIFLGQNPPQRTTRWDLSTAKGLTSDSFNIGNGNVGSHVITWSIAGGSATSCNINLQSSPNNKDPWTTQLTGDCTGSGSSTYATFVSAFVRAKVTVLTSSGSPTISVNYNGYVIPPTTVASVSIAGIADLNNIKQCVNYAGATADVKIQNCENDLPSTGGVLDARGIIGAQFHSANVTITVPTTILFGAVTFTGSAATWYTSSAPFTVVGGGRDITIFNESTRSATVFNHASVLQFALFNATIKSASTQTSGAAVTLDGSGGVNSNNRSIVSNVQFLFQWISINCLNTAYSKFEDSDFNGIESVGISVNDTYTSDEGDNSISFNVFNPDCGTSPKPCNTAISNAIKIISGSGLRIFGNKFQENFLYAMYVHWTGAGIAPNTVILHYSNNIHEWPLSGGAAVYLDATTGTLDDMVFDANRFFSVADNQSGIVFAANSYQAFARPVITGNLFDFIAGISTMISFLGNGNGDTAQISGNLMYGGVGTGTAVKVTQTGTDYSAINICQNNFQGTVDRFVLTSGTDPRTGCFFPDNGYFGFSAYPGVSTNPLNIPNNTYYGGLSTASGFKRFIGQDSSDNVQIGIDNQFVKIGGTTGNATVTGNGGLVVSYNSLIGGSEQVNGSIKTLASIEIAGNTKIDNPCFATNSANIQDCGISASGIAVIAPTQTVVQVNTTGITAKSRIFLAFDQSQGGNFTPPITCNNTSASQNATYFIAVNNGGTAFNVGTNVAPVANPACVSWWIIN